MRHLQVGEAVVTVVTTRAGNQKRTVTEVTPITARDIVLRDGWAPATSTHPEG